MRKTLDSELGIFILRILHQRVGENSAIPVVELCTYAMTFFHRKMSSRVIRDCIRLLRQNGHPVCSGLNGYYWPANFSDVTKTVNEVFRAPALDELRTARRLLESGARYFGDQSPLPTFEDLLFMDQGEPK